MAHGSGFSFRCHREFAAADRWRPLPGPAHRGEDLVVEADIFKDGHDVVAAILKWRVLGKRAWRETPMNFVDNDRWRGVCTLYDEAIHEYTVEAWTDTFRSWQAEFTKKFEAGISDLRSEALEGAALVEAAANARAIELIASGCGS